MARGRKVKEYSEEQISEALRMYSDAYNSFSTIQEATGVPPIILQRYIAQNGMDIIRRKVEHRAGKQINGDQISELILAGKSVKEVSSQLNVNINTVRNHMSEEAWTFYLSTRRRGRAPKATSRGKNLSIDDQLIIAHKMYNKTQLTFKEVQDATEILLKSMKKHISTLESIKQNLYNNSTS